MEEKLIERIDSLENHIVELIEQFRKSNSEKHWDTHLQIEESTKNITSSIYTRGNDVMNFLSK